jgi:hypothetical protein
VERVQADDWEKFNAQLEMPIPGQEHLATPEQAEAEGAAFMELMNAMQTEE